MALTDLEIKQWVENYVNTNPGYTWEDWNGYTFGRGLHHKFDVQLYSLQDMYTEKFKRLYLHYKELREGFQQGISDSFVQTTSEDAINNLKSIKDKGWRLADKLRTLNAEIAGREAGQFGPGLNFDREYRGTEYYLDLTDGTDAAPHTGLKYGNYTADVGTGAVTLIETAELERTIDNDWDGAWIWNVTRSAGAKITASTYAAGTWTLTHASISGQVSGDTYYILDAWLTLAQYTSVTVRSAGDKVYVRANTTETVGAVLEWDEDGDKDNWIYIIGCDSVTNDPWGDASDVKPSIDFNATVNYGSIYDDFFWKLDRMVFKNSTYSGGNMQVDRSIVLALKDCEFLDALFNGLKLINRGYVYAEGCLFSDNDTAQLFIQSAVMTLRNCDLDAGVSGGNRGIDLYYGGFVELVDCNLGQSNAFVDVDLHMSYTAKVFMRNCKHNDDFNVQNTAVVFEEDVDGVKGANRTVYGVGTITKDTGVIRPGGATSSAKMEPKAANGLNNFLSLYDSIIDFPFRIKRPAALTTITIYIRSLGTWGTYPTVDELYVEASYLDESSGGHRAKVQSNDVLSHISDWKAFDVTFTPLQEGLVYLNVYLKIYEDAGDGCYVSMEPPEIS